MATACRQAVRKGGNPGTFADTGTVKPVAASIAANGVAAISLQAGHW